DERLARRLCVSWRLEGAVRGQGQRESGADQRDPQVQITGHLWFPPWSGGDALDGTRRRPARRHPRDPSCGHPRERRAGACIWVLLTTRDIRIAGTLNAMYRLADRLPLRLSTPSRWDLALAVLIGAGGLLEVAVTTDEPL